MAAYEISNLKVRVRVSHTGLNIRLPYFLYICSMEDKKCYKCGETKSVSLFSINPSRPDGFNSQCKECHSKYRKEHYLKNKQKYINKAALNKEKFVLWFKTLKKSLKCKVCGEDREWVLDFHHRDPNSKDTEVSKLRNSGSKNRVLEEINKCDVLCSNCHRDLHYKEKIK